MAFEKKWVEVECQYVDKETEKALAVIINEENMWIPKSQIAPDSEVNGEGQSGMIKISEWIAGEKGIAFETSVPGPAVPAPAKPKPAVTEDEIPF